MTLDLDQPQQLFYAPASYGQLDPSKAGRWVFAGDKGARFVVWTDDEEGAGVLWAVESPGARATWRSFQVANLAGVSATTAYELAIRKLTDPQEGSGSLANANPSNETE